MKAYQAELHPGSYIWVVNVGLSGSLPTPPLSLWPLSFIHEKPETKGAKLLCPTICGHTANPFFEVVGSFLDFFVLISFHFLSFQWERGVIAQHPLFHTVPLQNSEDARRPFGDP